MKKGYQVRVATRPFTAVVQGQSYSFEYGTILVAAGLQTATKETLAQDIEEVARRDGLDVWGVGTGLTSSGIDLGSGYFEPLVLPKVLLPVGTGTIPTQAGELWHLLDQRYLMPPVVADMTYLSEVDFWKYNVIVLTGGTYPALTGANLDALKRWLRDGGTLVTIAEAVPWASTNGLTSIKIRKTPQDSTRSHPYVWHDEYTRAQDIAGSIFQVRADRTHPLAYGYKEETLPVFKDNTVFMEKPKNPYATPFRYTTYPLVSGYISKANLSMLSDAAAVVVNSYGKGRVVLMADNPNFRAFWFGTNRMCLNALFFGAILETSAGRVEE